MPILKIPENNDIATSVASGASASTLTCIPRPIIMIAMPQKTLSSIRWLALCEAGSSSSRHASSRPIAALINPDACRLPSLPKRMLPTMPAPPRVNSSTVAKLPLRPATV